MTALDVYSVLSTFTILFLSDICLGNCRGHEIEGSLKVEKKEKEKKSMLILCNLRPAFSRDHCHL